METQLGKTPYRGGFGEYYCSQACYDNAGKYGFSVMMQNQQGVCGFCQKSVSASMYGAVECGAIPYENMTLFICTSCASKAKSYLASYPKCCMCQKNL